MDPSSPDVKRPSRNLISTPGPNPIQLRSLYMTKDSACPLSSLMACTRSTGQEAGKINVHKTKRSITERRRKGEREREREEENEWETDKQRKRRKRKKGGRSNDSHTIQHWVSKGEEELCVSLNETAPETESLSCVSNVLCFYLFLLKQSSLSLYRARDVVHPTWFPASGRVMLTCWIGSWWGVCLAAVSRHAGCIDRGPCRVHVGLLLKLADVFLVSNSLVPEPVWYLTRQSATRHRRLTVT